MNSVSLVFVNHATYRLAVTNFGDYSALQIMPWYVATAVRIGCSHSFSRSLSVRHGLSFDAQLS